MMAFLLGKWKLLAALGAAIALGGFMYYIWSNGRAAEKVAIMEKIQKNVEVANEIQNRNRRASDDDITKRLRRWQRD